MATEFSIKIHFQDSKGHPLKTIEAREGDNILDLAHEYDIDLEGAGARLTVALRCADRPFRGMRGLRRLFDVPCHFGRRFV